MIFGRITSCGGVPRPSSQARRRVADQPAITTQRSSVTRMAQWVHRLIRQQTTHRCGIERDADGDANQSRTGDQRRSSPTSPERGGVARRSSPTWPAPLVSRIHSRRGGAHPLHEHPARNAETPTEQPSLNSFIRRGSRHRRGCCRARQRSNVVYRALHADAPSSRQHAPRQFDSGARGRDRNSHPNNVVSQPLP
jgi:hypothetical protein